MQPLFPLFFIICHPYIPLHFGEMMFTLVSPIFGHSVAQSLGASPRKNSGRYRGVAPARGRPPKGGRGGNPDHSALDGDSGS